MAVGRLSDISSTISRKIQHFCFCFEKAQIIQAKIEEEKNQEEIMAVGRLSDISSTALLAG